MFVTWAFGGVHLWWRTIFASWKSNSSYERTKGRFRKRVVGECALVPVFGTGDHPNVPSSQFLVQGNIRQNHPFGDPNLLRTPNISTISSGQMATCCPMLALSLYIYISRKSHTFCDNLGKSYLDLRECCWDLWSGGLCVHQGLSQAHTVDTVAENRQIRAVRLLARPFWDLPSRGRRAFHRPFLALGSFPILASQVSATKRTLVQSNRGRFLLQGSRFPLRGQWSASSKPTRICTAPFE